MVLHWIDWAIIVFFLFFLIIVSFYTKRYTRSVADFLVANRCAGRYLLSISTAMAGLGAISIVGEFEMFYNAGFSAAWWKLIFLPASLIIAVSGWIAYRYRETRVMTMAQFFEVRYSKKFRVFCGILAWVTGVINMGIFPAIIARFLIALLGLPESFSLWKISLQTFPVIMFLELSFALLLALSGGMIVVIITDFLQGIFCNIVFIVILVVVLPKFNWGQIIAALQTAPEGASMINPYHSGRVEGFNIFFFLIMMFTNFYAHMAWQGRQGYNAAAKSAHESKMASIISVWRALILNLLFMMVPILAYTLMHHMDFSAQAAQVQNTLSVIDNPTLQNQLTVPTALKYMLPTGLIGLFASIMIAAAISTDDSYLHSWGTIFVQDVIMPFRKKPLKPQHHLWFLRLSMVMVAVIIFFFSLFFKQTDYVLMFCAITGAFYFGGAGCVIIGGLYWCHGRTWGAWAAMIVGAATAGLGVTLQQTWSSVVKLLLERFPDSAYLTMHQAEFPFNGIHISFLASLLAILVYVVFSLLEKFIHKKHAFNLEKMLHRGKYAIKGEHAKQVSLPPTGLKALLPSKEFTGKDKLLYYALLAWVVGWVVLFVLVTLYHFVIGTTDNGWSKFWLGFIWLFFILGALSTFWFLIGGAKDMKFMFDALKVALHDKSDDGQVMDSSQNP